MSVENTISLIEAKKAIPVFTGDPIDDRLEIPELREAYRTPPGAFMDFMNEIKDNFERREDGDIYRVTGAIGIAQVICGAHIMGPTKSKCAFGTFVCAASGSGKGAPQDFIRKFASELGLIGRVSVSTMSSTKQIQKRLIEAGGSLLYMADDCPKHLKNWSDPRSPLSDMDEFFRSSSTGAYSPTSIIRSEFAEEIEKRTALKTILSASKREGWMIPRLRVNLPPDENGETPEGPVDYQALAKMPHSTGREIKRLMMIAELLKAEAIKNVRFVPFISITPDSAGEIIRQWTDNGGMGRMLFIHGHDEVPELKSGICSGEISKKLINEWLPRIPDKDFIVGFRDDDAYGRYHELTRRIDALRDVDGITGKVATRYGQLMIDLATLCAFFDFRSRTHDSAVVGEEHIDWAFSMVVKSMRSLRDFMEGEQESDGLEQTEWENILFKIKSVVQTKKFKEKPYLSVISNALYRDKIKKIIDAADSNSFQVDKNIFFSEVIRAISQSQDSPLSFSEENPKYIDINQRCSWKSIRMTPQIRGMLSIYIRKTGAGKRRK